MPHPVVHFPSGCVELTRSKPLKVSKNNILYDSLPAWGPEFQINIHIRMKKWIGNWAEIFRFSAKDMNLQEGSVPLLLTKSGSFDELNLSHSYNSSELLIFNDMGSFKSRKWYRFRVSLKKYVSKNY